MSTVSFGSPERHRRTAKEKAVRFMSAIVLLGLATFLIFGTELVVPTPSNVAIGAGALVAYLLLAYFVDLEPDYENLGYSVVSNHSRRLPILGWLYIDDPFQWSDGVAREFLFYRLLLSPGRFVAVALTDPILGKRPRKRGRR